jgi:aspartyl-tRNA(Asn)/glutamyl-tRNA(Gln) amidotransferase subunit B
VEIVTEPDLHSPEQAREWLQLLRTTMRQLGVSDVNMEEGSLRCDANVSLRPAGTGELGVKTELKNMNSFRFIERGIRAEVERQRDLIESGAGVVQETLHFDPAGGTLTPLRSKEEAHDYRYFPEPDLVPVAVTQEMIEAARRELPELPDARAERYQRDHGLDAERARQLAFRDELGDYFERALNAADGTQAKVIANWVGGDLVARIERDSDPADSKVAPEALATLVGMVEAKAITRGAAQQVLDRLVTEGGDPAAIVESEGLGALGAGDELGAVVDECLEENPEAVASMRAGKDRAVGAIVGCVMRKTKGRADGGEVTRLVREKLSL